MESVNKIDVYFDGMKGRPGAVVRAVSLSHQVAGSMQPLRKQFHLYLHVYLYRNLHIYMTSRSDMVTIIYFYIVHAQIHQAKKYFSQNTASDPCL